MKVALLILLAALAGCQVETWSDAAGRYQCTEPQMQKASAETLFCKKEGGYSASYCYSTAIMRNCTPKHRATAQGARDL